MMDLPEPLEQLDHLVHPVKLVPLDLKEMLVTKDHRYCMIMYTCACVCCVRMYVHAYLTFCTYREILVQQVPLVTQEPKAPKERKEREVFLELMEQRVLRYLCMYIQQIEMDTTYVCKKASLCVQDNTSVQVPVE